MSQYQLLFRIGNRWPSIMRSPRCQRGCLVAHREWLFRWDQSKTVEVWREVLYALYFSPCFFLSVSLILASCVAFILMMLLKPFRLIQATPQQNRRAQMDFRGCTKTSSSNAAGRFLLRFTRLTSHLIEELGTTELLEDEGTRVNWDGDFRWFKVSEDVQQPQLLVFFFLGGGKFPNVSSCFHDQFLHTEFSFLLQRMPCAFWLSRTDSPPLGCGGLGWWAVQCISFGHLPQGLRPLLVFKGRYQRGGRDGPITLLWCLRQPWVGQFGAFEGPNLGSLVAFRLASRMRHEDGWIRWIAWQKWVQMDWLDRLLVDSFWKNLDFSRLVENRFDDFNPNFAAQKLWKASWQTLRPWLTTWGQQLLLLFSGAFFWVCCAFLSSCRMMSAQWPSAMLFFSSSFASGNASGNLSVQVWSLRKAFRVS